MLLNWLHLGDKPVALFIEPVGKDDQCDEGNLVAHRKVFYDRLFKEYGLKVLKEGRFLWHSTDKEFEHYLHTQSKPRTV